MYRSILILIVFSLMAGCTPRVVYEEQPLVASLPNALNINKATAKELESLPHIGRKTAEKIVEFREANGPFRRVEHLMQVRGISENRFVEIRQFLTVE